MTTINNLVKKHMHATSKCVTHVDKKKRAMKGYEKHKPRLKNVVCFILEGLK